MYVLFQESEINEPRHEIFPLDPRILNSMKPLFCTCFRCAMHLRIKPDDVLGNPGVTHQSSQWVRNAVGTERVTTHAWVNEDDSMSYG